MQFLQINDIIANNRINRENIIQNSIQKEGSLMQKWEGIGIGESDFKSLRLRKNYFIDKTMYIKNITDNQSKVVLVTRPRRFGKTLNMSMLRYFFDCNVKDGKKLFEGLKIMEQG